MKKKIKKIRIVLDIENSLYESPILALCDEAAKLGKASRELIIKKGWLILYGHLKKWVAKGVASEVHDFTLQ